MSLEPLQIRAILMPVSENIVQPMHRAIAEGSLVSVMI